ncbi:hypothetical protein [Parasitella parasitica]|uniref:Cysteine-rich transmembrane CYSTM domain-containing protein n=1 Tax=Parasitella parasitica TaxID=35722 RepID=A0A0B7N214_9FUNG|nr:hypothetical protein [Parasitella parasitica]
MSEAVTDIRMATLADSPSVYPSSNQMSTINVSQTSDQNPRQSENHNQDTGSSSSFLLRLRGGGGCITDCLAAIGCCCICEECCC